MTALLRQHRMHVIIAFAMVYVLWGSTYLAIAVAVKHMPPAVMASTRFIASGAIMLALCAFFGRKIRISKREVIRLGTIGVLLLTGGNLVVGWAEKYVASGLAALVLAVTPIWIALIEAVILKKARLSSRGIAGLGLGTLGLGILLWPKLQATSTLGRMELLGCIALIFASLSWVSGSLISKHTPSDVDPFVATGWEMLLAGIVNTGLALALGSFVHADWNSAALWSVAYLVVGGSLLGFTAYIWLLEHVPTAKVATYAYVNPIVAVILGAIFLHEKLDAFIVTGTAVIVAGVVLVTTAQVWIAKPVPVKGEIAVEAEA
jgi:drug/metabolite transporter (DMT)-like permease